jgi:hypothetical protein
MRRSDRIEIVRRALARGWSQNEIEDRTGINKVDRYTAEAHEEGPG